MGWLYTGVYPRTNKEKKEYIESGFTDSCEVVASSMVNSVYYGAIRNKCTGEVSGYVVLTRMSSETGFGQKGMSEEEGPLYYDCPAKVLKALTPTTNETALIWRQNCLEQAVVNKKKRELTKFPVGTIIQVDMSKIGHPEFGVAEFIRETGYYGKDQWRMKGQNIYITNQTINAAGYEVVKRV